MRFSARASKRLKWAVPLAVVSAFLLAAKTMNSNPPTNLARTSAGDADPEMRPKILQTQPDLAAKRIAGLSLRTYGRRWQFVSQQASPDEVRLVFRVPVIVFSDVLTVTLQRIGAQATQVEVESHSQIGQGDFGENRRHVRQMMTAIGEEFASL